jgi:hypothetical protein
VVTPVGIVYCGPYAELIEADNRGTYPHEGYAARVMPDGTLSGSWGGDIPDDAHIGFRAACACGWTGETLHPPGDYESDGYQAAEAEWDREHLQPLIAAAAGSWRPWADAVARQAAAVAGQVMAGRLADVVALLDRLADDLTTRQRIVGRLAEDADRDTGGDG